MTRICIAASQHSLDIPLQLPTDVYTAVAQGIPSQSNMDPSHIPDFDTLGS